MTDTQPPNYIITARPDGMSYEAYKLLKNEQKKKLKQYKRGRK
jgi:hypothetical protein